MADDIFVPVTEEDFFAPVTTEAAMPGVVKEASAAVEAAAPPKPRFNAMDIEPNPIKRGLAAVGGAMYEVPARVGEKFRLAFPGKGQEEATRSEIARDRTERGEIMRSLEATTAGQVGGFVGKAAPMALGGSSVPLQAGLSGVLGFLGGGSETPTSFGQEMLQSGAQGAADAAITGGITKGIQAGAKAFRGARGNYVPEGAEAMQLNEAARRAGIPSPTIGQLDPTAPRALQANPLLVRQQAQALERRMSNVRDVPNPAGGMQQQVVPGGALSRDLKQSVHVLKGQADDMYNAVDEFAQSNKLGKVPADDIAGLYNKINKNLVVDGAPTAEKSLAYKLLKDYDKDAFNWVKPAGSPKNAGPNEISMKQYHNARVATGRALNRIERTPTDVRTADQNKAYDVLLKLKDSLDESAESWATKNSGNQEAMGLYNRAKDFYRDVAAPALTNPFGKKVASLKGFESPERMYQAVTNPLNRSLVDRLRPTMPGETLNTLDVLQNLPGMKQYVTREALPQAATPSGGIPGLKQFSEAIAPARREFSRTQLAKNMRYGAPAPGYVAGPTSQFFAESARDRFNRFLGSKK